MCCSTARATSGDRLRGLCLSMCPTICIRVPQASKPPSHIHIKAHRPRFGCHQSEGQGHVSSASGAGARGLYTMLCVYLLSLHIVLFQDRASLARRHRLERCHLSDVLQSSSTNPHCSLRSKHRKTVDAKLMGMKVPL